MPRVSRVLRVPRVPRVRLPRWWPAAACVLLGSLAGLGYGLLRPAEYTATSYVAVVPGDKGDPMTALGFAQAYGRIATDTAVLAGAQRDAGVPVAELRAGVRAVTSPDAPMIEITGSASRADEAADVANAVARSLTEVASGSAKDTGVELTAFSRARAPREPSTPAPALTTAVGGSAGLLIGALVLLVRPGRDEPSGARTSAGAPAGPGEEPAGRSSRRPVPAREKEAVR
ncbi:YveK family protein [Streptomyces sp. TR06-5]|uniref:YveK family protein n=1 Tax=Streptomyces sp. TR06-5 TaxID=3385976 RepID=UPI0039A25409